MDRNVSGGDGWCTNCHGTTFAEGDSWINNGEVPNLIRGDDYQQVSLDGAKVGDKILYINDDGEPVHSATVVETDGTREGTMVRGLGGLEENTSVDQVDAAWPLPAGIAVFRKNIPDRVVDTEEIKQLRQSVYPD